MNTWHYEGGGTGLNSISLIRTDFIASSIQLECDGLINYQTKRRILMRRVLATVLVVLAVALVVAPARSFAQAPDTVWVPATVSGQPNFVNDFINGDTTASGQRNNPNRVYKFYDDSTYYWTGSIFVNNFNLTLTAPVPAAGHVPPMIYPGILSDGSVPVWFIESLHGPVTIKHLYLSGTPPDNRSYGGSRVLVATSGDSDEAFTADSCVFDDWYFRTITGGGQRDSYYITNCVFQNLMYPDEPFFGDGYGVLNGATTDTLWMVNNTFFACNSYIILIQDPSLCKYIRFEHNTVFLTQVNPLWIFEAVNADISNNVFYGWLGSGQQPAEITAGYYDYDGQSSSLISLDTLLDIGPKYGITEADRHITVDNNAYAWPQELVNDFTAWNDSVKAIGADTLELAMSEFMNPRTSGMFADHSMWPNLQQANNDSVDPGFPASAMQQVSLLWQSVYDYRSGDAAAATFEWWVVPPGQAGPYPGSWPLLYSLAYTNPTLQSAGTDGFALGDLNWFPKQLALWQAGKVNAITIPVQTVPSRFDLSQNYPNPFNPSTDIKVTLDKPGVMNLTVYNVLGQVVKVVAQGFKAAGTYTYNVSMDQYASGVYFYTLRQGSNIMTRKMLLLK